MRFSSVVSCLVLLSPVFAYPAMYKAPSPAMYVLTIPYLKSLRVAANIL